MQGHEDPLKQSGSVQAELVQSDKHCDTTPAAPVYDVAADPELQCPPHTTERKLLTKIDLHVMPFICILFLLAFLDRVNIGNAVVFKLNSDLKLTGVQYNTALTIFFVPYVLCEIPSNLLLKKFKPHRWLSGCIFGFGLATLLQGFVNGYSGLLATRFFLGVFEAGIFPGCAYMIGMWYKRAEAQKRFTFFFNSATLAGAFGGLLASAIGKLSGVRGYSGWRWIFIVEGLLTIVTAVALFFLLPNFPEDAKWLTEEERVFIKARLGVDHGRSAAERNINLRDIGRFFMDYKVFLGALMYFGMVVPAYGFAYFAPTIIRTYGYSPIQTQLFSVPPWAAAFVFAMFVAYVSDRVRHRYIFAILPICIAMAGCVILLTVHNNRHMQYGALFLFATGTYSAMPVIICWFNMNLGGHHRRAVGAAWQIGFGNIGGIIATYAFLPKDAPAYRPGCIISLSWLCLSILSCTLYLLAVWSQNRSREKAPTDLTLTESEKTEKGDLNPDYRYLL